jgi:putative ribosome biogenesis GTPase RsgA
MGELFAEISALDPLCKFRDGTRAHKPGCAVRCAVSDGTLNPERLRPVHYALSYKADTATYDTIIRCI